MQIIVTGRHVELSDEFKAYVTDKAAKLDRYYDRIQEIAVIVGRDSGLHEVEIIVRADHRNRFVAKERQSDPFVSVDRVIAHLERQLTRHKQRHRNRMHLGRNGSRAERGAFPAENRVTPSGPGVGDDRQEAAP